MMHLVLGLTVSNLAHEDWCLRPPGANAACNERRLGLSGAEGELALSACKGEILRRGLTLALHRSETIDQLLASVKAQGVPGDFMECGTWRGGLSAAARALQLRHGLGERHTVLADSFKSFPTPRASAAVDNYLKMDSAVDSRFNKDAEHGVHHVVHSLRALGLLSSKVLFVEGFFNETLCQLDDFLPSQIAVLRVDSDMFLSVLQTLCCLYDRVAVGGWLIIDDWGSWPAAKRAVIEFLDSYGLNRTISMRASENKGQQLGVWHQARELAYGSPQHIGGKRRGKHNTGPSYWQKTEPTHVRSGRGICARDPAAVEAAISRKEADPTAGRAIRFIAPPGDGEGGATKKCRNMWA
jgi:hypothetical protein